MEGSIRSCLVKRRNDFVGYGFNLHAEKGKLGQYVGKVDEGSPAEAGGLREADRIVEVNGANIGEESHQQVVTRIKSQGDQVTLLVADKTADQYCRTNKIVISSSLDSVQKVGETEAPKAEDPENMERVEEISENADNEAPSESIPASDDGDQPGSSPENDADSDVEEDFPPPPPELIAEHEDIPTTNGVNEDEEVADIVNKRAEEIESVETPPREETPPPREETPSPREETPPPREETPPPREPTPPPREPSPPPRVQTPPPPEPIPAPVQASSDPLPKVSAKEMREMLKNKKKADPRKDNLSAKAKLDMFKRL